MAGARECAKRRALDAPPGALLELLVAAGAPVSGDALAARLGVRAGLLSVTLRWLPRRGLIVVAARERARPGGWVLRGPP